MNNPDKGTQTDLFETKASSEKSDATSNQKCKKLLARDGNDR